MKVYLSPSNQENNVGYGDYGTEKSRMIQIVEIVKRELEGKADVKVANYDSTLASRAKESDQWGSDVYVSIHSNASGSKQARGCEVFAYSKESKGNILAHKIYQRLEAITPTTDRGVKYNQLYETGTPVAYAVLIEVAFHDNAEDSAWILSNFELIGKEIANGICDYFETERSEKRPDTQPVENEDIKRTKEFQRLINVDDDGIFGPISKKAATGAGIKSGKIGEVVKFVQNQLNRHGNKLVEDGIFGPNTNNAVINFQKAKSLVIDGWAGGNTMAELLK